MEQIEDNIAPRYCAGAQPSPSEIAAANMLKSGGMGVQYIADAQTLIAARNAYWDGVKADVREKKRKAKSADGVSLTCTSHETVWNERRIARAFALNHTDDWADRLSPARRHGLD